MELFEQINNDIKEAMKARDKVRLETLRNIKKVFLEAKTAPGANDTLTDADALKILQKLAKQGKESANTFMQSNRTEQEIESIVTAIIAETGAQGMKDMGRVMGLASKQMAGKAEGGAISSIVKKLLA